MYFRPLAAHYVLTIVATLAYVLLYLFFEELPQYLDSSQLFYASRIYIGKCEFEKCTEVCSL